MSGLLIHLVLIAAPLVGPVQAALAHFEAGEYHEAIRTLIAAHHVAPEDAAINYWLARSYYEQKNYDLAIAYGEQAVKTASENAEYHRWLGRAYGAKAEQSHSFFLARRVKKAFETAVKLAPLNIAARRDLMQYLVEAPGLVGGDKEKAKQQIHFIAELDSIQGGLACAAFFSAEKKWKEAEVEYLAVLDQHPDNIEPYMEAADFFADRKDTNNLDRVLAQIERLGVPDPRHDFYRAVVLVLRRADLSTAAALLDSYVKNVPQRSDYPSHKSALRWLAAART